MIATKSVDIIIIFGDSCNLYSILVFGICDSILDIEKDIVSLFDRVYSNQQENYSSYAMLQDLEDSAVSYGCEYFRSFKVIHDSEASSHLLVKTTQF